MDKSFALEGGKGKGYRGGRKLERAGATSALEGGKGKGYRVDRKLVRDTNRDLLMRLDDDLGLLDDFN